MISICSQQLIKNRKTEDAATMEKSGFLIRDTTAKQLQDIIDDDENSLALVFKRNEEVAGYLIGFDIRASLKIAFFGNFVVKTICSRAPTSSRLTFSQIVLPKNSSKNSNF